MFNLWRIPACELSPPSFDRLGKFILERLDLPEGTLQVVEWDCNSAFPTVQRRERVRPSKIVLPYPIPSRFQIRLEQGVRNSPWGIHRSWGRKARTFSRGRACGSWGAAGALASWPLTSDGAGVWKRTRRGGWGRARRGVRKGGAAGEKLRDLPASGKLAGPLSRSGGEAPANSSLLRSALCCPPLPLAPAHALRPPAPLKSPQLHS